MKSYVLSISTALFIITGCTSSVTEYKWIKSTNTNKENNYKIADSICIAEAYRAAPESALSDCIALGSNIARNLCLGDQASNAKALRDRIYYGCMMGKGWEKQAIK